MKLRQKIFFSGLILILILVTFFPGINIETEYIEAATGFFIEGFTTTTYRDATASNADWDTGTGRYNLDRDVDTQITTDVSDQIIVSAYENYLVWSDNRSGNYNIYMYNILTGVETQITDSAVDQMKPNIWGDYIVWENRISGNREVYMYQISTEIETNLTAVIGNQGAPVVSENYVVWIDSVDDTGMGIDLYKYQLSSGVITTIPVSATGNAKDLSIYQNNLTWVGCTPMMDCDIYTINLPTAAETRVTNLGSGRWKPVIYDDYIAWEDFRDGNWEIYTYKISTDTEIRVTNNVSDQYSAAIHESRIIWHDTRNTHADIYMCDILLNGVVGGCLSGDTKTRVTTNSNTQGWPDIYDNYIAFLDNRNGNYDIYIHASTAQSTAFISTSTSLLSATLTATEVTPIGTNIDYYMSNDNGATWEAVTSGVEHAFSSSGTQPKWKALLTHTGDISAIPYITKVSIEYHTVDGRRHPVDTVSPENISNLNSVGFPYSLLGSEIILMWTNPPKEGNEDYDGVDIYSAVGNCKDLEFEDFKKIGSTTAPQAYSYPVFGIEEPEKNHCFAIHTRDTFGNLSDGLKKDIVPGDTVKTFNFKNQETDETDTIETITKLTQEKTKDLIETYEAFDNKKHNLFLAQEARGKFLKLTEYGYSSQIYYVSTQEKEPHRYLFNSKTMLDIFGNQSLGILGKHIDMISKCNSGKSDNPFNFLSSMLLLDVTRNGEIWYFDKQNDCRISITTENALNIVSELASKTNLANLKLIPVGK